MTKQTCASIRQLHPPSLFGGAAGSGFRFLSLAAVLIRTIVNCPAQLVVTDPGDSGPHTLREAIKGAASGKTITFDPGLVGPIVLNSDELPIGQSIHIVGPGAGKLTVEWVTPIAGNGPHRVFEILAGASVTISGLTISNGIAPATDNPNGNGDAAIGGGILNSGTLTLSNCWVVNNTAFGGDGIHGGVGFGGGIANFGTLYLYGCTISGNRTEGGLSTDNGLGAEAQGGGIFSLNGPATIVNCTIAGNSATGGANFMGGQPADGQGGGLYLLWKKPFQPFNSMQSIVNSCTISSNSAIGGNGVLEGFAGQGIGGGVYKEGPLFLSLANTIVADNDACGGAPDGSAADPDIFANAGVSLGFNFIGITNGIPGWLPSDLAGSAVASLDPLLGPLQDNGGPTPTMLLQAGSSAINAGGGVWLATDQRGLPRPVLLPGYPVPIGGDGTDIGAVEMQTTPGSSHLVWNLNDDGLGSLRQAVNDSASGDTVAFSNGLTGAITLTSGEITLGNDIIIQGPGVNVLAVDGSASDRVFKIYGQVTANISGLTISNGLAHSADNPGGTAEDGLGGGILNNGNLMLSDCWITGNAAQGGDGSTAGAGAGGGISSSGTLILFRCTLSGNSATGGNGDTKGAQGAGGAMLCSSLTTLVNCTLSGNTAVGGIPAGLAVGGGVFADGPATVTAVSCTVSGNYATGGQSDTSPGGLAGGGGIYQQSSTATIQLLNTIIAGNGAGLGASPPPTGIALSWDVSGSFVSLGFNLVGVSAVSSGWITSDQVGGWPGSGLDPKLGPLQNNGGATPTMMPLNGSPALDNGNSAGLSTDQRGQPRPVRSTNNSLPAGGDGADIGAVEAKPSILGMGQMKAGLGGVWISWNSEPGWTWTLEENSDALTSPTAWIKSSHPVSTINGTNTVTILAPTDHMFFRLKGADQ